MSQARGTASAKALREERGWCVGANKEISVTGVEVGPEEELSRR